MTEYHLFIENEGALFRGNARGWPQAVWSEREKKWLPYTRDMTDAQGNPKPKGVEWGDIIPAEEAAKWEGAVEP